MSQRMADASDELLPTWSEGGNASESSPPRSIQSDVCSNGEEVIAIAELRYIIDRITENSGGVGQSPVLTCKRGNLVFDGEPAIALRDRDKFHYGHDRSVEERALRSS